MEQNLAHYQTLGKIGAGGMGEVFRARDTRLGREVALKLLPEVFANDPERLGRFRREAKLLASLNHAHIATLHGFEEAGGRHFLVMELVEGEDLAQRLSRGALPTKEALKIIRDVADALQAAHAQGIVHRDLKPANIKVTPEGKVKVLDFGLAKAYESDPSKPDLTQSPTIATALGTAGGVILGTAAYMSPEQARGKAVDKLTDVWALGCVLYELVTGNIAFPGETVSDTIAKILEREPDWSAIPAETPPGIQRLLHRCLEKDKSMRLQDVGEVRIEADAALSGTSQSWTGPIPIAETRGARRPGGALGWFVAVVASAAAVLLAVLYFGADRESPQVIRSTIPQPEGSRFVSVGDYAGPVVVSSDGRRVAFVANDANLNRMLWVRELDALEARALPGTEGATFPFWSPNSRSLGFFTESRLMRVEISGGLPITLCDAPNGRGGTWGPKGVIVFSPDFQTGISRVPDTGGTPAVITTLDSTLHSSHRWPEFMPDGDHFIYIAVHHDVSKSAGYGLYFTDIDEGGGEGKRVMSAGTSAVFASGHLLYVRENTLMAVPFDPVKGEMRGTPVTLIDKVQNDPTTWRSAISASADGVLAYHQGSSGVGVGTRLVIVDRKGKELSAIEDAGVYYHFKVSHDGNTVACTGGGESRTTPGAGLDIFLFDIARGVRTRLSFSGGADVTPVWSPDGKRVAYATIFPGANVDPNLITIAQADGGGEELVLQSPSDDVWLSDWSRDGRYIVYSRGDFVGLASDIWVLPLVGNRDPFPFLTSDLSEDLGSISPDGRWMAYSVNEEDGTQIYVSPFTPPLEAGGSPNDHRTFAKWQISNEADTGSFPLWSSKGTEIFFIKADGTIRSAEVDGTGDTFRSGRVQVLCQTDPWNFGRIGYDVMPDDQGFIVNSFSAKATPPITLVQNWTLELNK